MWPSLLRSTTVPSAPGALVHQSRTGSLTSHRWRSCTVTRPSTAVIPDVIDGDEAANDALVPHGRGANVRRGSARQCGTCTKALTDWSAWRCLAPRVCLGSSSVYAQIGTPRWWTRTAEAMDVLCDKSDQPVCKLHGLRMLDPDVFSRFPFASAGSTNIAQNVRIDSAWRGTYTPASKEARAQVMRERIESRQSLTFWERIAVPIQRSLFGEVV